jgi:hypothetical protein
MFFRPLLFKLQFVQMYLLPTLIKIGPPRFRRFVVDHLPFKSITQLRDVVDVMHNTSVGIYDAKKRALEEGDETVKGQSEGGRDIMSLLSTFDCNISLVVACQRLVPLVMANMAASEEDKLPDAEVLGQVVS